MDGVATVISCGHVYSPNCCNKKRKYEGICYYCKRFTERITKDHVIPRSMGGMCDYWNLVDCCSRCNQFKKNMSLEEFFDTIYFKEYCKRFFN